MADNAFQDCKNLKSVTIPSGVTYISPEAFTECSFTGVVFEDTEGWTVRQNYYSYCDDTISVPAETLSDPVSALHCLIDEYANYHWFKE